MKLKTLLTVMYPENKIRFVVMDEVEFDTIEEFTARVDDTAKLKNYMEYWVTLVDMDDNSICLCAN